MAADHFDWVLVTRFGKTIGAVGFLGNDAVAVTAFYDDADGNKDGKVSIGEWVASKISPIGIRGSAVVEVAMAARTDFDILMRDAGFAQMAMQMWLNFARGLIADGIYTAYFARGVSMAGKGIAMTVTSGTIKQLVIRKGFEKAAKEAFDAGVGRP